jgi:FkbM family methyltransferase
MNKSADGEDPAWGDLSPAIGQLNLQRQRIIMEQKPPFARGLRRFAKRFPKPTFLYETLQVLRQIGQKLHVSGAREIPSSDTQMVKLVLNKSYPLGIKGTEIELPKDHVIFKHISLRGKWEIKESIFLANQLRALRKFEKTALIDIGANIGAITLQAMNIASTTNHCVLIEPSSRHASAIRCNLSNANFDFSVYEFALSNVNGKAELFSQESNRGNSSIIESVVPISEKSSEEIQLRDAKEFFQVELNSYERFVLKSDTQGYDALILSRISKSAWEKMYAAVIEVWALPSIDPLHVAVVLRQLTEFSRISWDPECNEIVDSTEIGNFWLSKSSKSRNLFLIK